ncbi:MAG: hypothetical protein KKA79_02475 [Nanoarchaeota archaeon]|nr:hypothetical protein [Nanoarchaeota archaeon]MCG2718192.1 hypothetical protein [Nanoarchaeota archaeon]
MPEEAKECCPKFDPKPWDHKKITWKNKKFVKTRVKSFFHIPLNFGSVMTKTTKLIKDNGGWPRKSEWFSDENSLFGSDLYVATTKNIPNAENMKLSGVFISKVFEGSYNNMKSWIKETKKHVNDDLKKGVLRMYFFYTTCPKCAKKYGKNYVVILAQIR